MNTSADKYLDVHPGATISTPIEIQRRQAEDQFLRKRIRNLQVDLDEPLSQAVAVSEEVSRSQEQIQALATRQREIEILQELLETDERDQYSLEHILETCLDRVDRQLEGVKYPLEAKRAYDQTYMQLKLEQQLLKKILEDWQLTEV